MAKQVAPSTLTVRSARVRMHDRCSDAMSAKLCARDREEHHENTLFVDILEPRSPGNVGPGFQWTMVETGTRHGMRRYRAISAGWERCGGIGRDR